MNATDHFGRTSLMLAASCNLIQACRLLLSHGAKINACDDSGNTAMHFAYMYTCTNVITLLRSSDGDEGVKNKEGKSPADVAGDESTVKLFTLNKYDIIFSK